MIYKTKRNYVLKRCINLIIFRKNNISNSNAFLFKFISKNVIYPKLISYYKLVVSGLSVLLAGHYKQVTALFVSYNAVFKWAKGSGFLSVLQLDDKFLLEKMHSELIICYTIFQNISFINQCKLRKLLCFGVLDPKNPCQLLDFILPGNVGVFNTVYFFNIIIKNYLMFKKILW